MEDDWVMAAPVQGLLPVSLSGSSLPGVNQLPPEQAVTEEGTWALFGIFAFSLIM